MGKAIRVYLREDDKVLHEFNCSWCGGYILAKLRMDLDGAHCIVCPGCQHEHFRIISNGEITEDRAPDNIKDKKYVNTIKLPLSAYSKTSWEVKMRAKRDDKSKDPGGFLDSAWKRITGQTTQ